MKRIYLWTNGFLDEKLDSMLQRAEITRYSRNKFPFFFFSNFAPIKIIRCREKVGKKEMKTVYIVNIS